MLEQNIFDDAADDDDVVVVVVPALPPLLLLELVQLPSSEVRRERRMASFNMASSSGTPEAVAGIKSLYRSGIRVMRVAEDEDEDEDEADVVRTCC